MDGQYANSGCNANDCFAIFIDHNLVAATFTIDHFTCNYIAIDAAWHACEQFHIQFVRFDIEGNETASTTAKGNLIAIIVPPWIDWCSTDHVSKLNHITNFRPTMFAHPTILTLSACWINFWRNYFTIDIGWWTYTPWIDSKIDRNRALMSTTHRRKLIESIWI